MTAGPDRPLTFGALRRSAEARLAAAGVDGAALDARVLVCHAAGMSAIDLVTRADAGVAAGVAERLAGLLDRRLRGEPVARIVGVKEFWSLDFVLDAETLVPRPDSETVVAAALDRLPAGAGGARVLDLGTGTGCLLLAVLSERPAAMGIGIDRSEPAARTAALNARRLGLDRRAAFVVADWASPIDGRFDLVLSNPPYIERAAIAGLAPEVRDHDPSAALDGGVDGLAAYRAILAESGRILSPGGALVLELGVGQAGPVTALAEAAGLRVLDCVADLAGVPRALVAMRGCAVD